MPKTLASRLPPGVPLIIRAFSVNILPVAVVVLASRFLRTHIDIKIPTFLVVLIALLSIPAFHAARIVHRSWSIKRRAACMGAVLPPVWEGKSFGNLDILKNGLEMIRRGYPGRPRRIPASRFCSHA